MANGNGSAQRILGARLTVIASVVGVLIVLGGGLYNLALSVGDVQSKLDRNCRILVTIEQDVRIVGLAGGPTKNHPPIDPSAFAPFPEASC